MTQIEREVRARQLRRQAILARTRSAELHVESAEVARQVAETEQAMADTLARLALQQPHRASRLKALSRTARERAAQERQWADRRDWMRSSGRDEVA
jgi:hypothetical protein